MSNRQHLGLNTHRKSNRRRVVTGQVSKKIEAGRRQREKESRRPRPHTTVYHSANGVRVTERTHPAVGRTETNTTWYTHDEWAAMHPPVTGGGLLGPTLVFALVFFLLFVLPAMLH